MEKKKRILLTHPTGNANLRAALSGMHEAGILEAFYTCIATKDRTFFDFLSKLPGFSEFNRRRFNAGISPFIHAFPLYELGRHLSLKMGFDRLVRHESGIFSIDSVYRHLDKKVAKTVNKIGRDGFDAVYAYEDGALNAFKAAKSESIKTYYDLPIGYWRSARSFLTSELQNRPEWAGTLTGFKDSEQKLSNKDEEIGLADHVFVASTFTANSLKLYPGKLPEISVVPYGFPPPAAPKTRRLRSGDKIRLLFVGGLSQRKGVANVFEAIAPLKDHVELCIIGNSMGEIPPVLENALKQHEWIPSISHAGVLEKMRESDVLLFPSLFEGFGLVITEAMSQGTPVITTERTAGPDIIEDNIDGWLIEAGSSVKLQEKIEMLIREPARIEAAGVAASLKAAARPWQQYGTELSSKLLQIL